MAKCQCGKIKRSRESAEHDAAAYNAVPSAGSQRKIVVAYRCALSDTWHIGHSIITNAKRQRIAEAEATQEA